ncbi:MAG: ethanolamine ammonia-lyase subunit EutC [Gemmataceae bacterium]|nr:ethanolamine ammonia-lyase subunit EutC [Gemmataceae bacterium]
MSDSERPVVPPTGLPATLAAIRARTPARILAGRAGTSYTTATQLDLRRDHAAALDAVHAELALESDFGREWVEQWRLFDVQTQARDKAEYLMRPDLGRRLDAAARSVVAANCPAGTDVQVVIGDGLSVAAVVRQVPLLLPLLDQGIRASGWTFGRPFAVRYCRVGVLNDVGDLLDPLVVVLLIGERPGLATAESLSAYLAYRPRKGHTDANRNLISNIHGRGIPVEDAARRIVSLVQTMRENQVSGVSVKEELPAGTTTGKLLTPTSAPAER